MIVDFETGSLIGIITVVSRRLHSESEVPAILSAIAIYRQRSVEHDAALLGIYTD